MKRFNHTKPKRNRTVHVIDSEASFDEEFQRRFIAEMEEYRTRRSAGNGTLIVSIILCALICLTVIGIVRLFK